MSDAFGLGTFAATGQGSEPFAGLCAGEHVIDLRRHLTGSPTTCELLGDWDQSFERLAQVAAAGDTETLALDSLRPLVPVDSRQILCAGANYYNHVRQIVFHSLRNLDDERSDEELRVVAEESIKQRAQDQPLMFSALPSALCGADDDLVLWGPGVQHDWELELAVIIGRPARNVTEAAALDHVAGYTISNDISTRDVMFRPGFPMTDFLMTKSRPTFFPTGPYMVPRQFIPEPRDLVITLSVNGEVMQDEAVSDIINGVEKLVAYASTITTLSPGDMILTGSPAGNAGHHGNRWLVPGDLIEASITGLGTQRNRCVAEPAA